MYACIRETWSGFFEGVCGLEDRPLTFRDPPPRCGSRVGPGRHALGALSFRVYAESQLWTFENAPSAQSGEYACGKCA
jgi:hypothetical protein